MPSGRDGDTGRAAGAAVAPTETLTLALPKPGYAVADAGDIWLADTAFP
ncbi:MAG: NAD(P)H-hydrate epimerase [Acidimicrobiia bacterium]